MIIVCGMTNCACSVVQEVPLVYIDCAWPMVQSCSVGLLTCDLLECHKTIIAATCTHSIWLKRMSSFPLQLECSRWSKNARSCRLSLKQADRLSRALRTIYATATSVKLYDRRLQGWYWSPPCEPSPKKCFIYQNALQFNLAHFLWCWVMYNEYVIAKRRLSPINASLPWSSTPM